VFIGWILRSCALVTAFIRSVFARRGILVINLFFVAGLSGKMRSRLLRRKNFRCQGWLPVKAMRPNWREWLLMVCVTGPSCIGAVGCAVGGRSVSIDSNSRIPFFGLELQERQRKSGAPSVRSIQSDHKSKVRIAPVALSNGKGSLVRLGEERGQKPSLLAPISLPRTDANSPKRLADEREAALIDFR
jgi:hypothetical protein